VLAPGVPPAGINSCLNGVCRAPGSSGQTILIGGVPFSSLRLPALAAVDGWSRQFTYAVTESQT